MHETPRETAEQVIEDVGVGKTLLDRIANEFQRRDSRMADTLTVFLHENGVDRAVVERALVTAGLKVEPVNVHPLPPRGMAAQSAPYQPTQSATHRSGGVLAADDPLLSAVDAIESAATQLHGAAAMLRRLAP